MVTLSAKSFFNSSIAIFFSFILDISSKNAASKMENSAFTSENKLITPSLFTLCLISSPIRAFISFLETLPLPVILDSNIRTVSKKAAS
ncbi:hypothetical protein IMSAG192_00100 [Muribaculaceae bacterium]|nr:hypothetical protein IMSAG192_00100 [Muribaculaceae bacterium]